MATILGPFCVLRRASSPEARVSSTWHSTNDRTTGLAWVKVLPTDALCTIWRTKIRLIHGRHYNCQQYKNNEEHLRNPRLFLVI